MPIVGGAARSAFRIVIMPAMSLAFSFASASIKRASMPDDERRSDRRASKCSDDEQRASVPSKPFFVRVRRRHARILRRHERQRVLDDARRVEAVADACSGPGSSFRLQMPLSLVVCENVSGILIGRRHGRRRHERRGLRELAEVDRGRAPWRSSARLRAPTTLCGIGLPVARARSAESRCAERAVEDFDVRQRL